MNNKNLGKIKTLDELKLVRERLKYQALIQEQKINADVNTLRYNMGLAIKQFAVQLSQKFVVTNVVKMLRKH